jgi:hypothetical protein
MHGGRMAESGAVDERRGAQGALGNDETNTERVADRAKNGRHGAEYSRREYLTRHRPGRFDDRSVRRGDPAPPRVGPV